MSSKGSSSNAKDRVIPPQMFWIWMGKKRIYSVADFAKLTEKDTVGKFQSGCVKWAADENRDLNPTMWLDVFSMTEDGLLAEVVGSKEPSLWAQYLKCRTAVNDLTTDLRGWVRNPKNAYEVLNMLTAVRKIWNAWLADVYAKNKKPEMDKLMAASPCLQQMHAFCKEIGVEIRYLDISWYPHWLDDKADADAKRMIQSAFFEIYFRGSNYGSGGDCIRVQMLIDNGGVYIDHDDTVSHIMDAKQIQEMFGTADYSGLKCGLIRPDDETRKTTDFNRDLDAKAKWKAALSSNSPKKAITITSGYMAAPPNHPVLLAYRTLILQEYEGLIKNKDGSFKKAYTYTGDNFAYWADAQRTIPKEWFDYSRDNAGVKGQSEFEVATVQMTGPNQLDSSVRFAMGDKKLDQHDDQLSYPLWVGEWRHRSGFGNAWLNVNV